MQDFGLLAQEMAELRQLVRKRNLYLLLVNIYYIFVVYDKVHWSPLLKQGFPALNQIFFFSQYFIEENV